MNFIAKIFAIILVLLGVTCASIQHVPRPRVIPAELHDLSLWSSPSVAARKWKHPCEEGACYPASGNLLIGRGAQLSASSTCGLYQKDRFCIESPSGTNKCYYCDSRNETIEANHRIQSVISRNIPGTRRRSWWQSENGVENVSIRLDLESQFQFTHLLSTFKTPRPAAMLIERSSDFGNTWKVYQYFAHDCSTSFPGIPPTNYSKVSSSLSEMTCEHRYSSPFPSTEGEVIFRALPRNSAINDPNSQEVQELIKITNLRINFTKLHGDNLTPPENHEKHFYAIYDMTLRGSCYCNGHASQCISSHESHSTTNDSPRQFVHAACDCAHNTKGANCEECQDLYRDLPWMPAYGTQTNACKKCNCNNHATSCHFDAAVYEASGKTSGGVCDNCQHNTTGNKCELCKQSFFKSPTKDISEEDACQPCECNPEGSLNNICDPLTGQCICRPGIFGRDCSSSQQAQAQPSVPTSNSDEDAEGFVYYK